MAGCCARVRAVSASRHIRGGPGFTRSATTRPPLNLIRNCVRGEQADRARIGEHRAFHALHASGRMNGRSREAIVLEIAAHEQMEIAGGIADVQRKRTEGVALDCCRRGARERMRGLCEDDERHVIRNDGALGELHGCRVIARLQNQPQIVLSAFDAAAHAGAHHHRDLEGGVRPLRVA